MARREKRFRCSLEILEERVVMASGIEAHEVYSWQLINYMRADPTRFANEIEALYSRRSGTYHGYSSSDPVWTELRKDIDKDNGKNGWTFSGMLSFLRSQPKLSPYLLQDDLTLQAYNHTVWMEEHGYAHSTVTTRGEDLPGFSHTP